MNVTMNSGNARFSSMRAVRFASAKEEGGVKSNTSNRDQVTISQEGRDNLEVMVDKTVDKLSAMTKEEFMDMLRQWREENQPELEVDPYYDVDPDGSIANKIYFESYLGQLMEQEENIKCYYADAYQEAVSAPIDSLAFITGKYLNDQSKYFAHSMPAQERKWAFHQLSAMLTGAHVGLNDPYALAAYGGTKTVDELDKIAKQAVKDKLDALIKEKKEKG